ncbi:cadherin domain-containing protein, partial [Candidatus Poribacteria bacterium]|nr:cadherin domain-containing protein [Candidatus Poribacteria bacterium]
MLTINKLYILKNKGHILKVALCVYVLLMLNLLGHAEITPMSERTTEVQTAIVAAVGVSSIDDVTETHLAEITLLNLKNKGITKLKSGDFSGMTKLDSLNLYGNQLSSLPDGIFDGLTLLTKLRLGKNTVDPMVISVTLERVAANEFKAKVPTGAPFSIVVPVSVTTGTVNGGANTLTISTGEIYSGSLTVTRTAGTTDDVTADIGTLPSLPSINHYGYTLTKPDSLPILINRHPSNEFAPVFSEGTTTSRSITENTNAGQNIGTSVVATDENGDTITYSLSGTDAASFDIVSTSGQLQTKVALDYETKSSYSVIITATDTESQSGTITVTINVTDVNEAPVFSSDSLTLSIAENTEPGVYIGSAVTATDDDGDTLSYSLSGTDAASFSILRTIGQIRTNASLDYETKNSYSVTVTATDGDDATDTIAVTINVTNVTESGENVAPI